MDNSAELDIGKLVGHVSELTRTLLSDGANPGHLVYALTSVAADMGLQVCDDPLETVTALMMAISHQAENRLESDEDCDDPNALLDETEIAAGGTIH